MILILDQVVPLINHFIASVLTVNSPRSIYSHDTRRTCACCRSAEKEVPRRRRHKWHPPPRGGPWHPGRCTPLCVSESLHRRSQSRRSTHQFSSWETHEAQVRRYCNVAEETRRVSSQKRHRQVFSVCFFWPAICKL